MKGDFSRWRFDPDRNYNGVLGQQGRVSLDVDITAGERIGLHWRETNARDVIGAGVVAVPASEPDGFELVSAKVEVSGGVSRVRLNVKPGRAWVDGLLTYFPDELGNTGSPVPVIATYFEPPIQSPQADPTKIGDNIRDVVVLEVSHEEMSAFQAIDDLLEPALGGIDTTERIHTRVSFRLFRLNADDQDCLTIAKSLIDDWSKKGKLTVSLTPVVSGGGDCPAVTGGGYTGFEHQLYRIEVAQTSAAKPMFKWSRFNGGLVGTGKFDSAPVPKTVTIHGNRSAILYSGLTDFYLEALAFDRDLNTWQVVYGAKATLDAQNDLALTDPPLFGAIPAGGDDVFFRLWDGILAIDDFTNAGAPVELRDGIHLIFDPSTADNYRPGDYWIFPVRAGEIDNPEKLIDHKAPQGIHYHRAPIEGSDQIGVKISAKLAADRTERVWPSDRGSESG